MSDFLSPILWLLVTLGILVTFHELGHFLAARYFGVKVLRFSIGFGRPFWSFKDRRGTEIAVAPIPLGGYVKMLDEREGPVPDSEKAMSYNSKPAWQKAVILFAGPFFNLMLAVFVYWLMFVVGKPEIVPALGEPTALLAEAGAQSRDRLTAINGEKIRNWQDVSLELLAAGLDKRDTQIVVRRGEKQIALQLPLSKLPEAIKEETLFKAIGLKPWQPRLSNEVAKAPADLPAARAGVRPGDRILTVNGEATPSWQAVVETLARWQQQNPDSPLELRIQRGSRQLTITIPAMVTDASTGRRIIGISPHPPSEADTAFAKSLVYTLKLDPLSAIPAAVAETWRMSKATLGMFDRMLTGKASLKNISGPITIARVASDSAGMGLSWFLAFLALVSLSLAIINLMPVPMLDGGQLLFLGLEKIKGSALSEQFHWRAQTIGLLLLLGLMGVAFYNDILRLVS
jgi:regulator of sigma E protease